LTGVRCKPEPPAQPTTYYTLYTLDRLVRVADPRGVCRGVCLAAFNEMGVGVVRKYKIDTTPLILFTAPHNGPPRGRVV
jgi:hypothetical protein